MKISLCRMKNGKWHWQAHNGEDWRGRIILGGSIYGPEAIDYDTAVDAARAAAEWADRHPVYNERPEDPRPARK